MPDFLTPGNNLSQDQLVLQEFLSSHYVQGGILVQDLYSSLERCRFNVSFDQSQFMIACFVERLSCLQCQKLIYLA